MSWVNTVLKQNFDGFNDEELESLIKEFPNIPEETVRLRIYCNTWRTGHESIPFINDAKLVSFLKSDKVKEKIRIIKKKLNINIDKIREDASRLSDGWTLMDKSNIKWVEAMEKKDFVSLNDEELENFITLFSRSSLEGREPSLSESLLLNKTIPSANYKKLYDFLAFDETKERINVLRKKEDTGNKKEILIGIHDSEDKKYLCLVEWPQKIRTLQLLLDTIQETLTLSKGTIRRIQYLNEWKECILILNDNAVGRAFKQFNSCVSEDELSGVDEFLKIDIWPDHFSVNYKSL